MKTICPHCGAELAPKAIACQSCGSDAQTGWSEGASVDWELPDYDEIIENEFGNKKKAHWPVIVISCLLIAALIITFTSILF